MSEDDSVVLIVEDEQGLVDLFAEWLATDYIVRTAVTGEEALEKLDSTVDVVLLDRRLPDISGDDVLTRIRESESQSRVAMVSAVDPDFDIFEMGFDDYVVKPVSEEDLRRTVEQLIRLTNYESDIQEFFRLARKKATLEAHKSPLLLEKSDEYHHLERELEEFQSRVDLDAVSLAESDFDRLNRSNDF